MSTALRVSAFCFAAVATCFAQVTSNVATNGKLSSLIPSTVADLASGFPAGFQSAIGSTGAQYLNPSAFYSGLGVELSNLPASSSASALRYVFDPAVGAYIPTPQSLGPVLTERAETIGRDKLFIAVTYQRFNFDHQDNIDFKNFTSTVPIQVPAGVLGPSAVEAIGTVNVAIGLTVNEVTAHVTYGLTSWLDASYALSMLSDSLSFRIAANVSVPGIPDGSFTASRFAQATSTGLGDGVARFKAKVLDRNGLALALATDVRIPTGDEFNLQGAGAYGIKPFLIASYTSQAVSPHLNLGYQLNGKSYLASSTQNVKQRLPSQVTCDLGADISLSKRITLAFDALDQIVVHAPGVHAVQQTVNGVEYQYVEYSNRTRQEINGAAGFKALVAKNLVLTGNLLFRLNEAGVRSEVVPQVGLSYLF